MCVPDFAAERFMCFVEKSSAAGITFCPFTTRRLVSTDNHFILAVPNRQYLPPCCDADMNTAGDTAFGHAHAASHGLLQDLGETETGEQQHATERQCAAQERDMNANESQRQLQTSCGTLERGAVTSSVSLSDSIAELRHPQIDHMTTVLTPVGRAASAAACAHRHVSEDFLKLAIAAYVDEPTLGSCDSRADVSHCTLSQKYFMRARLLMDRGPRQSNHSAIQGDATASEEVVTTTGEASSEECAGVDLSRTASIASPPLTVGAQARGAIPSLTLLATAADVADTPVSSNSGHSSIKPALETLVAGKRRAEEGATGGTLYEANGPGRRIEIYLDPPRKGAKCHRQGGHQTMPDNDQPEQQLHFTDSRELSTSSSNFVLSEAGQDRGSGEATEVHDECTNRVMPSITRRRSAGLMNRANGLRGVERDAAVEAAEYVENSEIESLFRFAAVAQEFVSDDRQRLHRLRPLVEGR